MTAIRNLFALAVIAIAAASVSAQISTTVVSYNENLSRTTALSFKVTSRETGAGKWTDKKITYAIEEELLGGGFFPASGARPADLIVTYRLETRVPSNHKGDQPRYEQGRLILDVRDANTDQAVWRGVADWMSGETAVELYQWEDKLAEAARMLVRRFGEEGLAS